MVGRDLSSLRNRVSSIKKAYEIQVAKSRETGGGSTEEDETKFEKKHHADFNQVYRIFGTKHNIRPPVLATRGGAGTGIKVSSDNEEHSFEYQTVDGSDDESNRVDGKFSFVNFIFRM